MKDIRYLRGIVCLVFFSLLLVSSAGAASTEITVVLHDAAGGVAKEETVTYEWMEANLPVTGDGKTHYYHQGPVFEGMWEQVYPGEPYDYWDPAETINYQTKDFGALKGTAVHDLCDLVGGMSDGDTVKIVSSDGFYKYLTYDAVYRPPSRMGTPVVTWYRADQGYVPGYYEGMRLVFFADTSTNPDGWHVFGNSDMKETLPEEYWHWYWANPTQKYPSATGFTIKYVSRIEIFSGSSGAGPTTGGGGGDDDSFSWKPEMGTLNITSSPAGATVILDGEETEYVTNASIPDMPIGEYGVTVVRDGYATPREVWVSVPAGGTGVSHFDLEELYAPLLVTTWPEDAEFSLDGENVSRPAGVELEAVTVGNHSVTVTADGFVSGMRRFRVEEGKGTEIRIALSPVIAPEVPGASNETICAFGPGPAGDNVSLPFLSLTRGEGAILRTEEYVEAISPAGRLYVCLSHGHNSSGGEAVQPGYEVALDGSVQFPTMIRGCTVAGDAGDTVAVTGIYESQAGRVRVTGTGGSDDTVVVEALGVLAPGGGQQTGWYATFEGVTPASGMIGEITLPAGAYAREGNVTVEALLTIEPDTVLPDFTLGGVPLEVVGMDRMTRAALVRFAPIAVPEAGAALTADGDGEALLRLLLVTGSPGGEEIPVASPSPGDAPASGGDGGWLRPLFSWLTELFGQTTAGSGSSSPVTEAPTSAPPDETPVATVAPTAQGTITPEAPDTGAASLEVTIPPRGIYVTSVPVGAAVTLDGKATGDATPALFTGLKVGLHRVTVKSGATGRTATSDVWVHEGILVPVSFTLVGDPIESEVTIRSASGEPVAFTMNGAYPLYETPKEVTLTSPVSWAATQTGDAFISTMVPFSPHNGEVILPAAGTVASPCSLQVVSEPDGAGIFVDGYPTDVQTPGIIEHLSAGVHTVTVHMDGYLPESREIRLVDVPADVDETISFTLDPYASGDMCLSSDPSGAKVYLYGRYIGCRTPCTVSGMAIGTYAVGFTLEDVSKVVDVTVIPDDVAEGTCIFHTLVDDGEGSGRTEMTEEFQ